MNLAKINNLWGFWRNVLDNQHKLQALNFYAVITFKGKISDRFHSTYFRLIWTCGIIILLFPSSGAPDLDCQVGPREQVNQITHWLDSSNIYGSDIETSNKVREFRDGLLKAFMVQGREQLPINIDDTECRDPQGIIILLLLQLGFEKLPAQSIRPSCHTQIHFMLSWFCMSIIFKEQYTCVLWLEI